MANEQKVLNKIKTANLNFRYTQSHGSEYSPPSVNKPLVESVQGHITSQTQLYFFGVIGIYGLSACSITHWRRISEDLPWYIFPLLGLNAPCLLLGISGVRPSSGCGIRLLVFSSRLKQVLTE